MNKMATIVQMTFSNTFFLMKIYAIIWTIDGVLWCIYVTQPQYINSLRDKYLII